MQRSFILNKKEVTGNEEKKLSEIEDLEKLDLILNKDVQKIRDKIEVISKTFLEAQKRFHRAEKEYLEAKVDLFTIGEEKDKLVKTLHSIIENNESEKAKKLSQLLSKLEIKSKMFGKTNSENK